MSLQSLVQQGNYESAQAAFDAITTPIETRNTKAWTVADLTKELPPTESNDLNTMLGTMESVPVFRSAFIALSITGLEFASDERQQLIDTLAIVGSWSPELTQKAKRLGRPMVAPWQSAGITEPTLEDVQKAWVIWDCRRDMAAILQPIQAKSTAVNAWLDSLDTSEKTVAEVKAYCDALLASSDGNFSEVP